MNKLILVVGLLAAWFFVVTNVSLSSQFLQTLMVGALTVFIGILEIGVLVGGKK